MGPQVACGHRGHLVRPATSVMNTIQALRPVKKELCGPRGKKKVPIPVLEEPFIILPYIRFARSIVNHHLRRLLYLVKKLVSTIIVTITDRYSQNVQTNGETYRKRRTDKHDIGNKKEANKSLLIFSSTMTSRNSPLTKSKALLSTRWRLVTKMKQVIILWI